MQISFIMDSIWLLLMDDCEGKEPVDFWIMAETLVSVLDLKYLNSLIYADWKTTNHLILNYEFLINANEFFCDLMNFVLKLCNELIFVKISENLIIHNCYSVEDCKRIRDALSRVYLRIDDRFFPFFSGWLLLPLNDFHFIIQWRERMKIFESK